MPTALTAEFTIFATIVIFIILKKNILAGHGSHGSVIPSLVGRGAEAGASRVQSHSHCGLGDRLVCRRPTEKGKLRLRIRIPSILTELLYSYLAASSCKPVHMHMRCNDYSSLLFFFSSPLNNP